LRGGVWNDGTGVIVEASGTPETLARFRAELKQVPLPACIDDIAENVLSEQDLASGFQILPSQDVGSQTASIAPDAALCSACLSELSDPGDRRYRYGLMTCTACGPRYSIILRVPYDRPNTSMADFDLCGRCRDEYDDPRDRRFHAQPIACHDCGPRIELVDPHRRLYAINAISAAAEALALGGIIAIKGLGGFHLAARADNEEAVARLRTLKRRDAKPFALMVRDIAIAESLVELSDNGRAALVSPAAPIVLAPRRTGIPIAENVADGTHRLGVMLPYTPIHHLLFQTRPDLGPLVMTSANASDEPLVIDQDEAVRQFGSATDAILLHHRPIVRGVDDSVCIDVGQGPVVPIRRARGYVPQSIRLELACENSEGLCVGGDLKSAVAVVRGTEVLLSQHLGDLSSASTFDHFREVLCDLTELFGIRPQWIACDLHPRFLSSQEARDRTDREGLRIIEVQHHHAHAAALLAEHRIREPILAVVCDGVGHGTDETVWGGELLRVGLDSFDRLARLRPMPLVGGDAAAIDIRRCGLALLSQTFEHEAETHPVAKRLVPDEQERRWLVAMIRRGTGCVLTSAVGRLFDGVAALLGLVDRNDFEARAALALEAAAFHADATARSLPLGYVIHSQGRLMEIDLSPCVRSLVSGVVAGESVATLAAAFHDHLSAAWEKAVVLASRQTGIRTVGLTGGVFANALLLEKLSSRLAAHNLTVLRHHIVPPGDGGLALGQAAVAQATVARRYSSSGVH
jgi:hydrogenase maturation protein HypF